MKDKHSLLGINAGTASNRLVKDLLFAAVLKDFPVCFRCGLPLTRETFSIDHKDAWMLAEDPKAAFFDINNIAYSHLSCNTAAADRSKNTHGRPAMYLKGCRCVVCKLGYAGSRKPRYSKEKRRAAYEKEKAGRSGVKVAALGLDPNEVIRGGSSPLSDTN